MGLKYAVHRTDSNAEALYAFAEAQGIAVHRIGRPLDALGCVYGHTFLVEVKMPGAALRVSQQDFFIRWPGKKYVWRSEADVLAMKQELSR